MKKQLIIIILVFSFLSKGLFSQCMEDCVWPADANANGIANHFDLLAIGLAFQKTGPNRINQSTTWEPLDADNWTDALPITGANFKHCDSNGDGVVNWIDIEPIVNNFDMMNDSFMGLLGNDFLGDDLKAVPSQNTVTPGSTFEIDLQLGDENNQIENVYGIGFSLTLNSEYIESVSLNTDDSWLAANSPNDELITFSKYPPNENKIFIAISRIDGQPMSGFGSIGRLEIVIVDVIQPLIVDPTQCLTLDLQFEKTLAINELEEDLLITSNQDSVRVKHPSQINSTQEKTIPPSIHVFPNPVKDHLTIKFERFIPNYFRLNNLNGQTILAQKVPPNSFSETAFQLQLKSLPVGVYYLECVGEKQTFVKKIIIQ